MIFTAYMRAKADKNMAISKKYYYICFETFKFKKVHDLFTYKVEIYIIICVDKLSF